MGKKKHVSTPGYGKLLDAWVAPDNVGEPIGCIATSFTFSPVFFEEECLARFLQLETDPTEDGPVYLVEREEKLAQVCCAAALVDQHHCRGGRSLRWDMLSARMPGLQHAKVSLLVWSKLVRIIITSANLTADGYRRNVEVFGVLDFGEGCETPLACLNETVDFLRRAAAYSSTSPEVQPPALTRWNSLLDRVTTDCSGWGSTDERLRSNGVSVRTVFSGPGYPTVFDSLKSLWPNASPANAAFVVSPFFNSPEVDNKPVRELWSMLRQRGEASVDYYVSGEEIPNDDSVYLNAPESLLTATPKGRASVSTNFHCLTLPDGRSLHAKGIRLEDDRWSIYQIGSSNFTSAGFGLSEKSNMEANLLYIVDTHKDKNARKQLMASFPPGILVDPDSVKWKWLSGDGQDEVGDELTLPLSFGDATYHCDEHQHSTVTFSFNDELPDGWEVTTDGDERHFFGAADWSDLGGPRTCALKWTSERPPSGFRVHWNGSGGAAWWPVNVTSGSVLPPPEELKNLPLDVLINILSSARPLHRVLQNYLRRQRKEVDGTDTPLVIDPHKRVDTSQFILQRTRRVSWVLNALRQRIERPAVTLEFLRWRLRGPVGAMALANALVREAKSTEEHVFLISELALELSRAKPEISAGCISPQLQKAEIQSVICDLQTLLPENGFDKPLNLKQYVDSVFSAVLS